MSLCQTVAKDGPFWQNDMMKRRHTLPKEIYVGLTGRRIGIPLCRRAVWISSATMASRSASVTCHLCCDRCAFASIIMGVHDRHAFGAVNAVDSIYNIDYRKLGSFSVPMAFGIKMNV